MFPGVFSCRAGMEAQHAAPLLTWDVQQIDSMKSGLNEFSIVNCQLSIDEVRANWIVNSQRHFTQPNKIQQYNEHIYCISRCFILLLWDGGAARCASTHMGCLTNKFHEIRTEWIFNSQRFPCIHGTCLATVEAQHAAPHNDISHNPIIINNITNIFIVFSAVLSCCLGMEAQHAAPLLVFPKINGELNTLFNSA